MRGAWLAVGLVVLLGVASLVGSVAGPTPGSPSTGIGLSLTPHGGVPEVGAALAAPAGARPGGAGSFRNTTTPITEPLQYSLLAADNTTGTVFALAEDSPVLTAFDAVNGTVTAWTTFGNATGDWYGTAVAYNSRSDTVAVGYDTNQADGGGVEILSANNLSVLKILPFSTSWVPSFVPGQMFYWAPTNTLFVENQSTNDVMVLDGLNESLATWIPLPCSGTTEFGYCSSSDPMFEWTVAGVPELVVPSSSSYAAAVQIGANAAQDAPVQGITDPEVNSYLGVGAYSAATGDVYFENATENGALLVFDGSGTYLGNETVAPGGYVYQLSADPGSDWLIEAESNDSGSGAQLTGLNASTGAPGWQVSNGSANRTGYVFAFVTVVAANGTPYAVTSGSAPSSGELIQLPTVAGAPARVIRQYGWEPQPDGTIAPLADPTTREYYDVDSIPSQLLAQSEATGATNWTWAVPFGEDPTATAVDAADGLVYLAAGLGSGGQLYAFGAGTGALALNQSLPFAPSAAAFGDNDLLYLADDANDTIQVYGTGGHATSLAWTASLALPANTAPCVLAASPVAEAVALTACGLADGVDVATVSAGGPVAYYNATPVGGYALAFNGTGALYLGSPTKDAVTVLAAGTFAFVTSLAVPVPVDWLGLVPLADGVAVAGGWDQNINGTVVDLVGLATGGSVGVLTPPAPVVSLATDPSRNALASWLATGQLCLASSLQLPTPVTGLTVVGGNTTLSANWTAATGPPGFPITGYNVFWSNNSTGPWTDAGMVPGTNDTVSGLSDGTTYFVTVSATSGAGTGPTSTPADAVPLGVPFPPRNLSAGAATESSLAFNWTAPASDDGAPVTSYTLSYATSDTGPWTSVALGATLNGTLTGLAAGTDYFVKVGAANHIGAGHPSGPVRATTSTGTPRGPGGTTGSGGQLLLLLLGGAATLVVVLVIAALLLMRRGRRGASRSKSASVSPGGGPAAAPGPSPPATR